jgi:ribosomal protein S11
MVFQQFNLWPHLTVLQNIIEGPMHVQLGNSNSAITEQSGSGNVSSSVQIGDGHFVQSRQTGGEFASMQTGGRRTAKESKHLERRAQKTAWRSVNYAVKGFQRR